MAVNLSKFRGGGSPPTAIINAFSSGGTSTGTNAANTGGLSAREYLSGALTANALKTIINVTGGGAIKWLSAYTYDTTARTIRAKITIDGVVVYDATTNSIAVNKAGAIIAGTAASSVPSLERIPFNSQFKVEVASSLTETDKVAVQCIYEVS